MKRLVRHHAGRIAWLFCGLVATQLSLPAQNYSLLGTNLPGASQDFVVSVGAGITNISMSVAGTPTAFSHLLVKAGAAPSDTDYDFLATLNNQGNAINFEPPQLALTNYYLRVRTPSNSVTHEFTVTVATNLAAFRVSTFPATKPLLSTNTGTLASGTWHYFRIEVTTNLSGWRVILSSTNSTTPDLYINRDATPNATTFLKRSQSVTNDIIAFVPGEATPGAYFIGVFQPSASSTYTLRTEFIPFATLTWDPGTTHLGTEVYTNTNSAGGDFYFKITAQNTSVGAWRTALNVSTGEANIFLAKGSAPGPGNFAYKSERVGSDGFVVPSSAFSAGEDWYYLVQATPGAQWNLVSGEAFVTDLGTVTADGSSGSGSVTMGAEGMRFFKTSLPVNAVAWRLWLNGDTNTVLVKKSGVPVTGATDLSQRGQMLVVPSYLVGGQLYFVGVAGVPGATNNLDSRLQSFTDIPFVYSTNLVVTGFGYQTFRLQVPSDQLAWQMSVAASNSNPNIAVRRNFIPNESYNDAYSEVGSNITDSITLVPPTLSDGTFFITVYGTNGNYTCTLQSGNPEVTEINFIGETLNTDTNRTGWRFFKVSDIGQQLGTLGWDLYVTNHTPGTRIAIRRNAAPGIWNYRDPNPKSAGSFDAVSTAEFLQRPAHQADVWYVGVFNSNAPLGAFTLVTRELTAETVVFDAGTSIRSAVPPGKWQFFRVDVPANTLGWDVRVTSVTSGQPQIVVRRELLPVSQVNIGFNSGVISVTNWPSGNQWAAVTDWTGRNFSPDGAVNETGRILTMGMYRPLEPGTYYVGVINPPANTNEMSYTVWSRGIGSGQAIPVQDLDYVGGSMANTALDARDIAVYRVNVPTNMPTWKARMAVTSGEALMSVARGRIPNITALVNGSVTNIQSAGRKMQKAGNEHLVQLPSSPATNVLSGDYYVVVVSEGQATNSSRIGTGSAGYVMESIGQMPDIDLGLLNTNDIVYSGSLEGGESIALRFQKIPYPVTLGFELSLENKVGNPVIVYAGTDELLDPGAAGISGGPSADPYGNEGGYTTGFEASPDIITVTGAAPDGRVMVKARSSSGTYPDASYTLRIRRMYAPPIAFDGGIGVCTNSTNAFEFFRVDVPADALGWDVRIINILTNDPQLIVGRDFLPLDLVYPGWNPGVDDYWPSGADWIAAKDWTQRTFSPQGTNEDGRILAMGMGRPLEPGTYYIGIQNGMPGLPMSCSVLSRGIGDGHAIPVVDLPFGGGSVTNTGLAPREAAYYRVVVPQDAPSWQAKLTRLTGESMMVFLTNSIPSVLSGRPGNTGRLTQKTGNEHFVKLPVSTNMFLPAGTNYLAVVAEGFVTNATRIGVSNSDFIITSRGPLDVVHLGTVDFAGLSDTNTLEGGEVRAYQFDVPDEVSSLEAQLYTTSGIPVMVLRAGPYLPPPGAASTISGAGSVALEDYGWDGGAIISPSVGNANTNLVVLANPTNGTYSLIVKARGVSGSFSNATYKLVVRAINFTDVAFDGGMLTVSNHTANTWRYYRVEVPEGALGWDIRLTNVVSGQPKLVVRRDILPNGLTTTPWGSPSLVTNWPSTNQWVAAGDWTRRTYAPDGITIEDGRILAMGVEQPLVAGTYFIGVINSAGVSNMTYTLVSRGIGDGMTIPVTDLAYTGGSVSVSNLPPREAAYFRVEVPPNSPGWKLQLAPSVGEAMLVVLSNHVPSVDVGRLSGPLNGKYMQKAGNEHYLLLPLSSQTNLMSGTYYLGVIGEGLNPPAASRVGSGSSTFTLTSVGDVPIANLGTVGLTDIVEATTLEGGESRIYQFYVPTNASAIEMRLENRVGSPVMVFSTNTALPDPGGVSSPKDLYGNDGGTNAAVINTNIITLANPTNGIHTLAVKARALGTVYPDASYTLRVRQVPATELNFTPEFNTNGLSNVGSGLLLDSQRAYYKIVVPTNVNGKPVIGWELNLSQTSGQAGMRVRKDLLPSDAVTGIPFTPSALVIVPPVLTNGTWYVEVRGTNSTTYTLTSRALELQRPPWLMPAPGETNSTPGVSLPEFADSGVDTNGLPLPDDQGIDLELGKYHYYAAIVPTNNAGLLRVQMDAISGNPDIYLRVTNAPTASHTVAGIAGTTQDRQLNSTVTEYGNFVPLNGKTDLHLAPGTWYFAVRAVANANARYRLRLSTGFVQDLPVDGSTLSDQSVAGGDWRYYRVHIPPDAPANWNVTFSQVSGDVVLHVRDTVPPGNGASTNAAEYKDWISDAKNTGLYASYDPPGTYTFTPPPVRPDNDYYLGFRAKNDATFNVSTTFSAPTNPVAPLIPFYGGYVTNTIPPNSQLEFRIATPADAFRWRHTSFHSNSVFVYIENGTYPTKSVQDDFRSGAANSTQDRFLTAYPWLPSQMHYMTVTNPTALTQPFSFTMNGSSNTADDDNDGMTDSLEVQYFGTLAQAGGSDYDTDGVVNTNEFLEGTLPNDKNSFNPRLNVLATNGVVNVNPSAPYYLMGTPVTLTPTANSGYVFVGWLGSVTNSDNPLALVMNTNKTLIPRFRVPADDFDQRIPLTGLSATHSGLQNNGATKQTGEPNHAGNAAAKSLWWVWTAPMSGPAQITTAGTTFRNALGVYTGTNVNGLSIVATNLAGVGTNTSQVNFAAIAGTAYNIAVDGFAGATGSIVLNISMPGALALGSAARLGDGLFHFIIQSAPGQVLRVDATTDMLNWSPIATITNVTGTYDFADPASATMPSRYYRVLIPGAQPFALLMVSPQRLGDGSYSFTINGATGQVVRVLATTNASSTNWTTLITFSNLSGPTNFTDTAATNFSQRYYRAVTP